MDLKSHAEGITVVFAAAATGTYVAGYMALRIRANVLGLDPGFTLLNEGYVFAGARFLFMIFLFLLLASPLILGLRFAGMALLERAPAGISRILQWTAAIAILGAGFACAFLILSVRDLLLEGPVRFPWIRDIIAGDRPYMANAWMIALVTLASLSVIGFLAAGKAHGRHPLVWVMGAAACFCLFLLPVFHGALHADRKVRILGSVPAVLGDAFGPLGIVDRTSEYVTLLGRGAGGKRTLTAVKVEDLAGVPVTRILPLGDFLRELRFAGGQGPDRAEPDAHGKDSTGSGRDSPLRIPATGTSPGNAVQQDFFSSLASRFMMTFEALGSLGGGSKSGELWIADLDPAGKPSKPYRIGSYEDVSWPVASTDPDDLYALRLGTAVKLGAEGRPPIILHPDSQWVKLLGVSDDQTVFGLVDREGDLYPATLDPNGVLHVAMDTMDDKDRRRLGILAQQSKSFSGGRGVTVRRSELGGRGFDIFWSVGGKEYNVSQCGDNECGQPSLSPDFRRLLFIQRPRI